jgi:hypothetical protein
VNAADLIVLGPWLLFGVGLGAICCRLLHCRVTSHRHRRQI